jgi:integrase/recombinase XerD
MKHPLSVDDVARALEASEGVTRTLIETLYASGARVSEVVKLTWGDVNLETATVRLQGKKGDERCIPIGQPCLAALYALHNGSQGHPRGEARVFNLNEQQVRDRLKTVGRRIGVHLTPHLFRHAFAGHLHLNGANERVIQEWLGHRRVDTTALYLDGCQRAIEEKRQLITRSLAKARGRDEDPRALRYTIGGLVLR